MNRTIVTTANRHQQLLANNDLDMGDADWNSFLGKLNLAC